EGELLSVEADLAALRRQAHAGEELLLGVDDVREHVAGAPALARARGVPVGDRLDLGGEGRGAPPPGGERVGAAGRGGGRAHGCSSRRSLRRLRTGTTLRAPQAQVL